MNQQQSIVPEIHKVVIERYPMYQASGGFEQWLLRNAGTDEERINDYLDLLDSYGYMNGDGTLANDYQQMPDPDRVLDDIRERLARLSPSALEVLQGGSIEGEHFCVETVAALLEIDAAQASEQLREGEANGLIVRDGSESMYLESCDRYRFLPLHTRDLLYEQIPEEERLRLHREFIEFLSSKLDQIEDAGRREMLDQMISEHNKRFARPEPSPQKQT